MPIPRPSRRVRRRQEVEIIDLDWLFESDNPFDITRRPDTRIRTEPVRSENIPSPVARDADGTPPYPDDEVIVGPEVAPSSRTGFTRPRLTRTSPVLTGPYRGRVAVPPTSASSLVLPSAAPKAGWPSEVAVDGGVHGVLTYAAASLRGLDHLHSGDPRQDTYAFAATADGRYLVAALADGVSSATFSHVGAEVASRTVLKWMTRALSEDSVVDLDDLDWEAAAAAARRAVRAKATPLLVSRTDPDTVPTDADITAFFGTTLACLVVAAEPTVDGHRFAYAVISGDGSAAHLDLLGGWKVLSCGKPDASDGLDIVSKAVTPLPSASDPPVVTYGSLGPGQALVAMTDGIGDAFGDGDSPVGSYLYDAWRLPVDAPTFLQSAAFLNDRCHDDRTVVAVWA